MLKPELLAPAGNFEKLKIAFHYGADAVYIGSPVFGLRKYAPNFSPHELCDAVNYAHTRHKKVYLVLNGFAHQNDINTLTEAKDIINKANPDALIISDIGVLKWAQEHTKIPIHVSTQASVVHWRGCQFWKDLGAKRIILGREASIEDCITIQKHCPIECEIFIHGAMCASYSGKCVISNYTSGRDSNRGGCVQTCRHSFDITPQNAPQYSSHIMNAKDLETISLIPNMINAGIHSLKIEGRMKSTLYVANAVRAYRKAIDIAYSHLENNTHMEPETFKQLQNQLSTVSNRTFSTGGSLEKPGPDSINTTFNQYEKSTELIGTVQAITNDQKAIIQVKNTFTTEDILTAMTPEADIHFHADHITNLANDPVQKATTNGLVKIKTKHPLHPHTVIKRNVMEPTHA